jgi:hypothetical protein
MNSLIVHLPTNSAWSAETWALEHGGIEGNGKQVIIESSSSWLSITHVESILNDYDEDELAQLLKMLPNPQPYLIE